MRSPRSTSAPRRERARWNPPGSRAEVLGAEDEVVGPSSVPDSGIGNSTRIPPKSVDGSAELWAEEQVPKKTQEGGRGGLNAGLAGAWSGGSSLACAADWPRIY